MPEEERRVAFDDEEAGERSIGGDRSGPGVLGYQPGGWVPVVLCAAVMALVLGQLLALNDGNLVYALDDSYIGYALAEEIVKGNYGLNPDEASSPASTILWPFIVAPALQLPGGIWLPLIINLVAVLLTVHVAYGSLARTLRAEGLEHWRAFATFGAVLSVLLLSTVLVAFSGMEHGLQILLAMIVAAGLIEATRAPDRPLPGLLLAALAIGPLFRFEAMALTVPALVLMWRSGHRRQAGLVAVSLVVPLAIFVAFLTAMGVGPLPSSIMSRSAHMWNAAPVEGFLANLRVNLSTREGLLMAILCMPLLAVPFDRRRIGAERRFGAWLAVALTLHYLFGQFGYWGRYEAYVWGVVLVTLPFVHRRVLTAWLGAVGRVPGLAVAAGASVILTWSYAGFTMKTPLASNDIYIEHFQMNRLVTEFVQAPVAVNDVGYVSFRNDEYVLDLWGLTSHEVREMRQTAGQDVSWMEDLARRHDVELVMLYPEWFPRIPETWTPLGHLRTDRMKALIPLRTVSLVATRPETVPKLRADLERFGEGLPEGTSITVYADDVAVDDR